MTDQELLEGLIENQTEEDVRRTAQAMCACAFAHEAFAEGVEYVSVKPKMDGPGRVGWTDWEEPQAIRNFDEAVIKLAGPAWEVVQHEDLNYEHNKNLMLCGDFADIHISEFKEVSRLLNREEEQMEAAWTKAKEFVSEWEDQIREASERLMRNRNERDYPYLDGDVITEIAEERSQRGGSTLEE